MSFARIFLLILFFATITRSYGQDHVPASEQSVRINLNPVDGAVLYEVQVVAEEKADSEPLKFTVSSQESFLRLRLSPGKYIAKTRSINSDKRAGPWSEFQPFELKPKQTPATNSISKPVPAPKVSREYTVKVDAVKNAAKYQFEVVKIDDDGAVGEPTFFESTDPEMKFKLPASQYEARARSVSGDNTTSKWSSPFRFFIQRNLPALVSPANNAMLESTDDVGSLVQLKWQGEPQAASYVVYVFNSKNELVLEKQTEVPELEVNLPHLESYRWMVKAYSKREPASTAPALPGATAQEFSIDQYFKLELSGAEESSQTYGWLRHISSMARYEGHNSDNNSVVRQTLFTGEGEFAAGYWSRRNNIGILSQASLGGFLLKGTNYTYANLGVHGGYRKVLENGARLRVWLGLNYQELPEILMSPYNAQVNVNNAKTIGPQIQVSYLQQIDKNLGWQFMTSSYLSAKDMGSPNGLNQNPTWSYKIGLQGIYSWTPGNKWMMGYSYKVDQLSYGTTDSEQIPNTATLSGHYLILTYEFAFDEPKK